MKLKKIKTKKAVYYTLDALLAGMLIIGALILIIKNPFYENKYEQELYLSQDLLNSLSELKINEITNSFVIQEISNGNITNTDLSVLEQIGNYWATETPDKAKELFEIAISTINKKNNITLRIDLDNIYHENVPETQKVVSRRMIAGISKGDPLTGTSASAYLKRIRNKKTSSYSYFGGFIGQGNISFFIEQVPLDVDETKILDVYLEGDYANDFYFYVNNEMCNRTSTEQMFLSNKESMNIQSWSLEHCKYLIEPGRNNFTINFTGPIETNYIAGGLLRIDYRTDELQQNLSFGADTYYFPGIQGIANIYDSFYVPGDLETMNVYLNFSAQNNTQTYITIGERIINIDSEGGNQIIILTNEELLNDYNLDYAQLSKNTIPVRFASYNATTQILTGGNADVILITDFSRSMMRAVANWDMGNLGASCSSVFNDPQTRRTNMAKCVDNEFVDVIMNYTGNRIWPVFIYQDAVPFYNNPEDKTAIKGYINSYPNGLGKICMACAINRAYEILDTYSNDSRSKFVVVMTNGVPTHCADGGCTSTSTTSGVEQCEGLCTSPGSCPLSTRTTQCTDCTTNRGATDNAISSAQILADDMNVTMFTIGFGPIDECDIAGEMLTTIATIGNGTYQHSSNITELRLIYQNVSLEILERVQQENQTVIVTGNVSYSNLYWDSHINFTYNPIVSEVGAGKISVNVEKNLDTCDASVYIPIGLDIVDAKVISYSGNHWSDLVVTNNITVFNLSNYYVPYFRLGDPLAIQVPVNWLVNDYNYFFVETGESPENRTGCSPHNKFIYTAMIPAVTMRTDVSEKVEGCTWTIAYEDDTFDEISVPSDYTGTKKCSYQPGNVTYDNKDTYDVAMYTLLTQLDLINNTKVFVNINKLDLEIVTTLVGNIPYLWGPAMAEIHISK